MANQVSAKDEVPELKERFDDAFRDGPVPKFVVENFLFGRLKKNTGMPAAKDDQSDDTFFNSPSKVADVLTLAEANIKRIDALPSFEVPRLYFSAGGPGVGKTTDLFICVANAYGVGQSLTPEDWAEPSLSKAIDEVFLSKDSAPIALWSADRLGLLQLARLYKKESESLVVTPEFYLDNRAASNVVSLLPGNAGFAGRKDMAWDSTMGSGANIKTLEWAYERGYEPIGRAGGATLETRIKATENRNIIGRYYQSLPVSIESQDEGFRAVAGDIGKYAKSITLSWREDPKVPSRESAVITPKGTKISEGGNIEIIDREGYNKFISLYPQFRGYDEMPLRRVTSQTPRLLKRVQPDP